MVKIWSKSFSITSMIIGLDLLFIVGPLIFEEFNYIIIFIEVIALSAIACAIFSPRLIVNDKELKIRHGFFTKRIPLEDIQKITVFKKSLFQSRLYRFYRLYKFYKHLFRISLKNDKTIHIYFPSMGKSDNQYNKLSSFMINHEIDFKLLEHMKSKSIYSIIRKFCMVVIIPTLFIIIVFSMGGYGDFSGLEYYTLDSNYHTITIQIDSYDTYEDSMVFNINNPNAEYGDTFYIADKSFEVVKENGLLNALNSSNEITIVSPTRYLGGRWKCPIVEISCNNIIYLEYEEGKNNLLEETKRNEDNQNTFYVITFLIISTAVIIYIVSLKLNEKTIIEE